MSRNEGKEGEVEEMKVECPVCHREGVVEQRGSSVRIVHYEWIAGKRVFEKHTVGRTDGNSMETEKPNTSFLVKIRTPR